jgi:hypothetical protein
MGLHGFESRRHLASWLYPKLVWAIGAAVARFPDTEEVTGSIPVSPTGIAPRVIALGSPGLPRSTAM